MKIFYVFALSLLWATALYAQAPAPSKTPIPKPSTSVSAPDTNTKLKQALQDTNKINNEIQKPSEVEQAIHDTNVKSNVVVTDTNSKKILVKDTTAHLYNQYRGLLNDDPLYNPKAPIWQPIAKVALQNILLNLVDHYVLHLDFPVVGLNSWNRTFLHSGFPWGNGWKWDEDRFGNNFFLHP